MVCIINKAWIKRKEELEKENKSILDITIPPPKPFTKKGGVMESKLAEKIKEIMILDDVIPPLDVDDKFYVEYLERKLLKNDIDYDGMVGEQYIPLQDEERDKEIIARLEKSYGADYIEKPEDVIKCINHVVDSSMKLRKYINYYRIQLDDEALRYCQKIEKTKFCPYYVRIASNRLKKCSDMLTDVVISLDEVYKIMRGNFNDK